MTPLLSPASVPELVEAVRATPQLLAVGAGTKPRLSSVNAPKISMTRLSGLVEYDPGEFTFTALAGTPLREIAAALAARGQYMPFDPPLLDAGSTLGGTVAAGVSGPGRFRFGGLRDFILGVQFVDGSGRLLRMGGKVVKNAAGFDLPKFFVGSLGRFGILAEMTFKVFPRPEANVTLTLAAPDIAGAARILIDAANTRWEPQALDLPPGANEVCLRLAGPPAALAEISREILARWPGRLCSVEEAESLWRDLREFRWAHPGGLLVKVPLTPKTLPTFHQALEAIGDARIHVSAGGNLAFFSLAAGTELNGLDSCLTKLGLSGLTLRGAAPLWWGAGAKSRISESVKRALDPQQRFPSLDN